MTDDLLNAALDRYTVPPLSGGFADRVMERAMGKPAPIMTSASRGDRRGRWARGRTILIGLGAFGLMSAAAATTGIFGDIAKNVPVLGPLIARVAPTKSELEPKPVVVVHAAPLAKPVPRPPKPIERLSKLVDVPPIEVAPVPLRAHELLRDARRERIANRIAEKLDQRRERRRVLGLPQKPIRPMMVARRLQMLPPVERRATIMGRIGF
jgi:hypothetical protein